LDLGQTFFFWNGNGNRTGTVNSKLLKLKNYAERMLLPLASAATATHIMTRTPLTDDQLQCTAVQRLCANHYSSVNSLCNALEVKRGWSAHNAILQKKNIISRMAHILAVRENKLLAEIFSLTPPDALASLPAWMHYNVIYLPPRYNTGSIDSSIMAALGALINYIKTREMTEQAVTLGDVWYAYDQLLREYQRLRTAAEECERLHDKAFTILAAQSQQLAQRREHAQLQASIPTLQYLCAIKLRDNNIRAEEDVVLPLSKIIL
jgi:hypothetical protein